MALQDTITIQGEVEVPDAYIRVTSARVSSRMDEGVKVWFIVYDVDCYKDETARDAGIALPCPSIQHFKCDWTLDSEDNPIAFAYADLKLRMPDAVDC